MCLHPKNDDNSSDWNKITGDLNEVYMDMDSLKEFAGFCCYVNDGNDIVTKGSDLRVLHLNVCSILLIQADLSKLLLHSNIDICTLNETW